MYQVRIVVYVMYTMMYRVSNIGDMYWYDSEDNIIRFDSSVEIY